MSVKVNWDALGIGASLLCAIHCAILPLIFTSLPFFGINIIHNRFFEWGMIALAFFIGTYSLWNGYKGHHRSWLPMILFSVGFAFLVARQIFHSMEVPFLIPAVALIVGAHVLNYRQCAACRIPVGKAHEETVGCKH